MFQSCAILNEHRKTHSVIENPSSEEINVNTDINDCSEDKPEETDDNVFELFDTMSTFCKTCNRHFKHSIAYLQHIEQHKSEHICRKCAEIFYTREKLSTHLELEHNIIACANCPRLFNSLTNYSTHAELMHKNQLNWECDICPELYFSTYDDLIDHCRTDHCISCDICKAGFDTAALLAAHHSEMHENLSANKVINKLRKDEEKLDVHFFSRNAEMVTLKDESSNFEVEEKIILNEDILMTNADDVTSEHNSMERPVSAPERIQQKFGVLENVSLHKKERLSAPSTSSVTEKKLLVPKTLQISNPKTSVTKANLASKSPVVNTSVTLDTGREASNHYLDNVVMHKKVYFSAATSIAKKRPLVLEPSQSIKLKSSETEAAIPSNYCRPTFKIDSLSRQQNKSLTVEPTFSALKPISSTLTEASQTIPSKIATTSLQSVLRPPQNTAENVSRIFEVEGKIIFDDEDLEVTNKDDDASKHNNMEMSLSAQKNVPPSVMQRKFGILENVRIHKSEHLSPALIPSVTEKKPLVSKALQNILKTGEIKADLANKSAVVNTSATPGTVCEASDRSSENVGMHKKIFISGASSPRKKKPLVLELFQGNKLKTSVPEAGVVSKSPVAKASGTLGTGSEAGNHSRPISIINSLNQQQSKPLPIVTPTATETSQTIPSIIPTTSVQSPEQSVLRPPPNTKFIVINDQLMIMATKANISQVLASQSIALQDVENNSQDSITNQPNDPDTSQNICAQELVGKSKKPTNEKDKRFITNIVIDRRPKTTTLHKTNKLSNYNTPLDMLASCATTQFSKPADVGLENLSPLKIPSAQLFNSNGSLRVNSTKAATSSSSSISDIHVTPSSTEVGSKIFIKPLNKLITVSKSSPEASQLFRKNVQNSIQSGQLLQEQNAGRTQEKRKNSNVHQTQFQRNQLSQEINSSSKISISLDTNQCPTTTTKPVSKMISKSMKVNSSDMQSVKPTKPSRRLPCTIGQEPVSYITEKQTAEELNKLAECPSTSEQQIILPKIVSVTSGLCAFDSVMALASNDVGRIFDTSSVGNKTIPSSIKQATSTNHYVCDMCNTSCKTSERLRLHRLRLKCDLCTFTTCQNKYIHLHKHNAHDKFSCAPCDVYFGSRGDLHTHNKEVHNCAHCTAKKCKVANMCNPCDLIFMEPGLFQKHKDEVHFCKKCKHYKMDLDIHQRYCRGGSVNAKSRQRLTSDSSVVELDSD